jgi:uncharacterized MAPEG superfamily protein
MSAWPPLSVVIALVVAYVPRYLLGPLGSDPAHPRALHRHLEGRALRAMSAHQNGLEAFAPFAAAVLFCELRQVDPVRIGWLCGVFVAARVAYVVFYLVSWPRVRSTVWGIGVAAVLGLFGLAITR